MFLIFNKVNVASLFERGKKCYREFNRRKEGDEEKWLVPLWGAGGENPPEHNTKIGRNKLS